MIYYIYIDIDLTLLTVHIIIYIRMLMIYLHGMIHIVSHFVALFDSFAILWFHVTLFTHFLDSLPVKLQVQIDYLRFSRLCMWD